jgi:hypothetical protein
VSPHEKEKATDESSPQDFGGIYFHGFTDGATGQVRILQR